LSNVLLSRTPITDAGLVHLTELPAIQNLHVSHTKIGDKGLESIAKMPGLTVLDVSCTDITDQGIKQITKLPKLNWLLINGTKISDAGLAELANSELLPELRRVTISKDMKISEKGVEKLLKVYPKLQLDRKDPESPDTTPRGEKAVGAELEKNHVLVINELEKGVTSIDFTNCQNPSHELLKLISQLRNLSTANLSGADIHDEDLVCLEKLENLNNVLLNRTPVTDAGLAHLGESPSIQGLHINHTKISDNGLESIAKIPNLVILDVSHTDITDQGMKQIAKMAKLNWLIIQGTKVSDAGLAELADSAKLPELRRVSISTDMKISDEGAKKLLQVFPQLQLDKTQPSAAEAGK
jgi:internalin A